jgi:adenylosuccinate synthase
MGKHIAIVGIQPGDEGKGKINDLTNNLAVDSYNKINSSPYKLLDDSKSASPEGSKPLVNRRFQGGGNAGHTLVIEGEKWALHHVPTGITHPEVYCVLGSGMYGNPRKITQEIQGLQERGLDVNSENLGISARMHVTLDYHTQADQVDFTKERHTSTGNGIKQTAEDKYGRTGIRFIEFLDEDLMKDILRARFHGVLESYGIDSFVESYAKEREFLAQFATQEHKALQTHGFFLLIDEGAQGKTLCVDGGSYPHVTSSMPCDPPGSPDLMLGVAKLYRSSAGTGGRPFVSQMRPELENKVREPWGEFGTTTSKARDIAWADPIADKYACDLANITHLAVTCGDKMEILATLRENVKMLDGYKIDGKTFTEWDINFHKRGFRNKAEPIYSEFEPWVHFVDPTTGNVTDTAQRYVDEYERRVDREIIILGTGPGRKDYIMNQNPIDMLFQKS